MQSAELGEAVLRLIAGVLEEREKDSAREDAKIKALEAEGFRIVDGGQTGPPDEDGNEAGWQTRDWRTREVLAEGVGWDTYEASGEDNWYHIDNVMSDDFTYLNAVKALQEASVLPHSLAFDLADWIENDPDDARQLLEGRS